MVEVAAKEPLWILAFRCEDIRIIYGKYAGYSHLWRQLFSAFVKGQLQKTSKSRTFILTICVTLHVVFNKAWNISLKSSDQINNSAIFETKSIAKMEGSFGYNKPNR